MSGGCSRSQARSNEASTATSLHAARLAALFSPPDSKLAPIVCVQNVVAKHGTTAKLPPKWKIAIVTHSFVRSKSTSVLLPGIRNKPSVCNPSSSSSLATICCHAFGNCKPFATPAYYMVVQRETYIEATLAPVAAVIWHSARALYSAPTVGPHYQQPPRRRQSSMWTRWAARFESPCVKAAQQP
jgi:hypothetical protein